MVKAKVDRILSPVYGRPDKASGVSGGEQQKVYHHHHQHRHYHHHGFPAKSHRGVNILVDLWKGKMVRKYHCMGCQVLSLTADKQR